MNRILRLSVITLLVSCGCKHVANSEIVAKYRAAGGGDPDGATAEQMGAWLGKKEQEGIRKELTNLCHARQSQNPPPEWQNSDEGKICTGVTQANFFAPTKIQRKGTPF